MKTSICTCLFLVSICFFSGCQSVKSSVNSNTRVPQNAVVDVSGLLAYDARRQLLGDKSEYMQGVVAGKLLANRYSVVITGDAEYRLVGTTFLDRTLGEWFMRAALWRLENVRTKEVILVVKWSGSGGVTLGEGAERIAEDLLKRLEEVRR